MLSAVYLWDMWGAVMKALVHHSEKSTVAVDFCYYVAFGIYSFFHLLESTQYDVLLGIDVGILGKISTALMLFLLITRLLVQRFSLEALVKCAVIFSASFATFVATGSWILLSICLFVCAGRGIDVKVLMRILLWTTLAVFLLAYVGAGLGVIDTQLSSRPGELRIRDSCGFVQVNSVGLVAARICTAVAILRWRKSSALTLAIIIFACLFVEIKANSRTAEVYLLVLAAVVFFCSKRRLRTNVQKKRTLAICAAAVFGSFTLSFALMLFFDPGNSVMMSLSELLSNRIYSSWHYFQNYSLSLFGIDALEVGGVIWTGSSYATETLDNAWALWLMNYGIVPTAILLAAMAALFRKCYREQWVGETLIVFALICSLYAFCETSAFAFDFNPLLVLFSSVVYGDSVGKAVGLRDGID